MRYISARHLVYCYLKLPAHFSVQRSCSPVHTQKLKVREKAGLSPFLGLWHEFTTVCRVSKKSLPHLNKNNSRYVYSRNLVYIFLES